MGQDQPVTQSVDPAVEVVTLVQDLIRIDTTNDGTASTVGEALAAEYVEASLQEVGYDARRFETTSARRQGVSLRIPGRDPQRPALLIHGHLDVVPADPRQWSVPPLSGDLHEGMIWGRGAVDMKDTDGMILAVLRDWARHGVVPERDIVVLFLPDEEAAGTQGAHWLVDHEPALFHGVTEAVGEVGGFSVTIADDRRLYLIQTAEKGLAWLRLRAEGRAGHGSLINDDNAVTQLAAAVARIGEHRFPVTLTPTTRRLVDELTQVLQIAGGETTASDEVAVARIAGVLGPLFSASVRHTANPTVLTAGYKSNVIPTTAEAHIDGRFLPGLREEFLTEIDRLIGDGIQREFINDDVAVEAPYDVPLVESMTESLRRFDPGALVAPYLLPAGTDAKAFSRLGIKGYGFAPLLLPASLDFSGLFHGVDERVPVSSLQFGVRVLDDFLRRC